MAQSASHWLSLLIDLDGDAPLDPGLRRMLEQVKDAAVQRFDWGIDLADALASRQNWDSWLWPPLFEAWQADIAESEFRQVLSRLESPELHRYHARGLCEVLEKLVAGGGRSFAEGVLVPANALASTLWTHVRGDSETSEGYDWFTLAINRAAGPFAEFWLGSLSVSVRREIVARGRLEEPYRSVLDGVVQDQTPAGRMARAVLFRGFAFLFNVDETWTREHLVPLLTEPTDWDEIQAAWDGLMYGSLDVSTIDVLLDPFLNAAAKVRDFQDAHTREWFIDYLAALLIDFVESPIDEWIPEFLRSAEADERRRFAWAIWRRLGDMSDSEQRELWGRWLRRYWENRIVGVPAPLQDVEIEWMLNWLPQFHSLFLEGVEVALRMPPRSTEAFFLIRRLLESDHCEQHPEAVIDVLDRLIDTGSARPPFVDWSELIERLEKYDLSEVGRASLQTLRTRLDLA